MSDATRDALTALVERFIDIGWASRCECVVLRPGREAVRAVAWSPARGEEPRPSDLLNLYCAGKPALAVRLARAAARRGVRPSRVVDLGGRPVPLGAVLAHDTGPDPSLLIYALAGLDERRTLAAPGAGLPDEPSHYRIVTAPWAWVRIGDALTEGQRPWKGAATLVEEGILAPSAGPPTPMRLVRDIDLPSTPLFPSETLPQRSPPADPAFGLTCQVGQVLRFLDGLPAQVEQLMQWFGDELDDPRFRRALGEADVVSDGAALQAGFVRGLGERVDPRLADSWGQVARGGTILYLHAPAVDVTVWFWCDGHTQDRRLVQQRDDRLVEGVLEAIGA